MTTLIREEKTPNSSLTLEKFDIGFNVCFYHQDKIQMVKFYNSKLKALDFFNQLSDATFT